MRSDEFEDSAESRRFVESLPQQLLDRVHVSTDDVLAAIETVQEATHIGTPPTSSNNPARGSNTQDEHHDGLIPIFVRNSESGASMSAINHAMLETMGSAASAAGLQQIPGRR